MLQSWHHILHTFLVLSLFLRKFVLTLPKFTSLITQCTPFESGGVHKLTSLMAGLFVICTAGYPLLGTVFLDSDSS